jgi:hypothetical protein
MIFAVSLGAAGAAGCSEIGGGGRSRPRSPRPSLDVVTSSVFIRRPRLALFVSLVVSLAGLLALLAIPVAQRRNLAARPMGIFCFAGFYRSIPASFGKTPMSRVSTGWKCLRDIFRSHRVELRLCLRVTVAALLTFA